MQVIGTLIAGGIFIVAIFMTIGKAFHEFPVGFPLIILAIVAGIVYLYVRKKQKDSHPWRL